MERMLDEESVLDRNHFSVLEAMPDAQFHMGRRTQSRARKTDRRLGSLPSQQRLHFGGGASLADIAAQRQRCAFGLALDQDMDVRQSCHAEAFEEIHVLLVI